MTVDARDFDDSRRRFLIALAVACVGLATGWLLATGTPPTEALLAGAGLGLLAFLVLALFVMAYWGVLEVTERSREP